MTLSMMQKGIYFLPFFLPFIFIPFLPNPYEFPKLLVFVISIQLLLLLFIKELYQKLPTLLRDPLIQLNGCLLVILLLADLAGMDIRISLLGSMVRHQGLLLYLSLFEFLLLLRIVPLPNKTLGYTYSTVLILSLITIGQFIASHLFNVSVPLYNGRIVATLGNPNFLGSILVIELFYYFLLQKNVRFLSIKSLLLHLVVLGANACTRSQSAILGLLLGYALMLYYAKLNTLVKLIPSFVLIGAGVLTLFSIKSGFSIWDNQLRIWPIAVQKIAESPFIGYGQENFQLIYPLSQHYVVDSAHNLFLEIGLAGGIPTLLIFLLFIGTAFHQSTRATKILLIISLLLSQTNPISIAHLIWIWFIIATGTKLRSL